jgi:hypothetical protein
VGKVSKRNDLRPWSWRTGGLCDRCNEREQELWDEDWGPGEIDVVGKAVKAGSDIGAAE